MTALRLGKLPDRTPVRLTIGLSPELHRALTDYAALYCESYGQEESVTDLIPFMLLSFLDGDRAFARMRRTAAASPVAPKGGQARDGVS